MNVRFPRRSVATTLLLGLLLAACGTGSGTGSGGAGEPAKVNPLEAFTLAASKTTDAKTAKMAMTVKTELGGKAQDVSSEGVIDLASGQMRMTLSAEGETVEMISTGKVIYLKSPEPLPGGKTWMKMDIEALAKTSGQDLGALTEGADNDPTQALAYLKVASGDIQEVGKEQVRGTETTHYKATIDLDKALEQQPADKRKSIEKLLDSAVSSEVPADVFIDAEGRMRKMQYVVDAKEGGAAGAGKVDTTIEFFDFGAPVDVKAPADSETIDFADLIGGLGG